MLRHESRGDTLVEVIVAFTVFTLVAVGTSSIMNRGVAIAEQSLETTLVRQQIDAQAALLRYARSIDSSVWQTIRTQAATMPTIPDTSPDTCSATAPAGSFMLSVDTSGGDGTLTYHELTTTPSPYSPAAVNSTFDASYNGGGGPTFYGIWVVPTIADTGASPTINTEAYDMHIGTCWYVPGTSRPYSLGTIVRLYDTIP